MRRMKTLIAACSFAIALLQPANAQSLNAKEFSFDMRSANVAEVLQLLYSEAIKTPYVLAPEVLEDLRFVSFRYHSGKGNLEAFVEGFLESLGYVTERKNGVDFVRKKSDVIPSPQSDLKPFVYRPKHRNVSYLARVLGPVLSGSFSVNRSVRASSQAMPTGQVSNDSAAALIDQDADVLLFSGTEKEVERLKELLPEVDVATGEVLVQGLVYEVNRSDKKGSAFGLLANLLGGKLNLGISATAGNLGNFIQLKSTALDAVYSMLEADSRFKVISSPTLRIQSGSKGVFSVGQDVPVLGELSYPQGAGQAVQSVEYRSSGVIFEITPTVRDAVIEIEMRQQLSDFIKTTTGVNSSPTLTKRELATRIGVKEGEVLMIGGLSEDKVSNTQDGLSILPDFLHTKSLEKNNSEVILILQVKRL